MLVCGNNGIRVGLLFSHTLSVVHKNALSVDKFLHVPIGPVTTTESEVKFYSIPLLQVILLKWGHYSGVII